MKKKVHGLLVERESFNIKNPSENEALLLCPRASFSFEKTGHPDFHTCNVSAVKSARYKLRGEQQSAVTLTSVFGKRGEQ